MDNLEEMNRFLERYSILWQNQEEIENMKRTITSTKIETMFKTSQQTKVQDLMASQVNSFKYVEMI